MGKLPAAHTLLARSVHTAELCVDTDSGRNNDQVVLLCVLFTVHIPASAPQLNERCHKETVLETISIPSDQALGLKHVSASLQIFFLPRT